MTYDGLFDTARVETTKTVDILDLRVESLTTVYAQYSKFKAAALDQMDVALFKREYLWLDEFMCGPIRQAIEL